VGDRIDRGGLILAHQTAVTSHIRTEDSRQLPCVFFRTHGINPLIMVWQGWILEDYQMIRMISSGYPKESAPSKCGDTPSFTPGF
jgi:hypothetical protein